MTNKRRIIIDCDPGVDDAVALAYAAAHQESFEILAVTTVGGNLPMEKVTKNALDILDFYGLTDIPVAQGMAEPLIEENMYATEYHGENGLGDFTPPASERKPEAENAVVYLHRILSELPEGEKITLVELAPMTNLALLFKMFPETKDKIEEIIFMGGAACGGNVTPAAEFNIYTDPEAAKIVCKTGIPLVMCGLDVTEKCTLTRNQILKLCQSNHPVAKACGDMVGYALENTDEKYRAMVSIHDAVPFMYMLHPEIFAVKKAWLDVNTSEGLTRGSTVCDFTWWLLPEDALNALVLTDADSKAFQENLITALYELGDKE